MEAWERSGSNGTYVHGKRTRMQGKLSLHPPCRTPFHCIDYEYDKFINEV